MARRSDNETLLDTLLKAGSFRDYGPNGLQVEGKAEVQKLGIEHAFIDIDNPA